LPRPLPHFAAIATLPAAPAQSIRAELVARLVVLASLWSRAAHFSLLHLVTIEFHDRSHWLIRLQSVVVRSVLWLILSICERKEALEQWIDNFQRVEQARQLIRNTPRNHERVIVTLRISPLLLLLLLLLVKGELIILIWRNDQQIQELVTEAILVELVQISVNFVAYQIDGFIASLALIPHQMMNYHAAVIPFTLDQHLHVSFHYADTTFN